jgi:hypothetical protein
MADRKQWTVDIELTDLGYNYIFHGIGIVGFEPTREGLARIIGKTITEYFPKTDAEKGKNDG